MRETEAGLIELPAAQGTHCVSLRPHAETWTVREVLGQNGIVDLHPYQSIGGNGIRVGTFPSVDPDEISALTACIDWVVERI